MPSPQNREEVLFAAALGKPAAERAIFLDGACYGEPALRQRLEALLAAHDKPEPLPPSGAPAVVATIKLDLAEAEDEAVGKTIGRYKVLEKVGEGGCGVVYVAEQTEPVRRRVALKVIKLGMDTKQVVARFEAERQALAVMDHPNIAKVLDAGATENGRPYFVMELVRGIKITEYCDQNHLTTKERLDLFIKVCQAIQHAHQKGIIHRDIKPSNILVTLHDGVPVPKVIDFGIAKATVGQTLTDKTVYTQLQQFIGTPAYMSPEQAEMSGLDIDTRSDIYSLGVLLYELLAGSTPFDADELMSKGIDAMRKTIREKEPMRPSTRLATLKAEELTTTAKRRSADTAKLLHQLKGDLDWIVMKCLEKDRTRRYETANGLAFDIKRHLNHEAVLARPPTSSYRFQKLVRRNKMAFAAAAAVAMALILGLGVATWMFARERQAHHLAVAAEHQAVAAEREQSRLRVAAQQSLYTSLVGEARATRLAGRLGYRDEVFKFLQQARDLHTPQKDLADLRNEAVACLGDFVGLTPATFTNFPTNLGGFACLAPSGKLAAFGLSDGTVQLRDLVSGAEVARLPRPSTNEVFPRLCFNSTGDQLFANCRPRVENQAQALQMLPRHRLYSWTRDADGRWRETANRALPGAVNLLNNGTEVFATILDVGSLKSGDSEFRLFNVESGDFVAGYDVTNTVPAPFDFGHAETPDGRLLAVETWDNEKPNSSVLVNLYDWKTGQRINQLRLPMFGTVSLSPDGKCLAWLSQSGGAIYTVPGLKRIGQLKEDFERVPAVFWGNMVALPIRQQNRIRLWNLVTREDIALLDEPERSAPVAFSADGNSFLTVGGHYARLYRLNTPEKLEPPAHAAAVTAVASSPDGTSLASVGKDRVIRVCDATTGRVFWQTNDLPGPGQCIGYSPDGQWLATGDYYTDQVWIWDAHTGQRLLQLGTNGPGRTWSVQFAPNGRYLAAAFEDGIRIYHIESPETAGGPVGLQAKLVKSVSVSDLDESDRNLVFSPDSRFLSYWTYPSARFFLWDFGQSTEPHRVEIEFLPSVECHSFTPDGRQLLIMDSNGKIVTLEVPTGKEIASFQAENPQVAHRLFWTQLLCLSPDGSKLALMSASGLGVDIWDPKAGKLLYPLPGEAGTVYWLAWSPDSRRLAVARDNGNIALWNLDTVGQILTQLGLNP